MRAMLAERLTGGLRNHALSWLNGAFHLGWLFGPLLAGFTVGFSITLPFSIAAGALVLGAALAAMALEREAAGPSLGQRWWSVARERHAFTLLRQPPLRTLFSVHFAYACGVAAFYEFFPLWLVDVGGYDVRRIAFVNMGMCALMTFAALFAGRASTRTRAAAPASRPGWPRSPSWRSASATSASGWRRSCCSACRMPITTRPCRAGPPTSSPATARAR
jgi:DHA1 family tetracycline resistance protein-like MFS transporter